MSVAPPEPRPSPPARAFRWVLAAGLLLDVAVNLPGHLSYDSVNALFEARHDIQITWAPVAYAWIVGIFDNLLAGVGLFLAASGAVLFGSLMLLARTRPSVSWWGVAVAALAVLTPQLLIYQGIVWRDVLFANLSVAGFVLLAVAATGWTARPPWLLLCLALLSLALASCIRQNGVIFMVFAAPVTAWLARPASWRGGLAWSGAWIALGLVLIFGISHLAQPAGRAPGLRPDAGLRILQHYDVVGVVVRDPSLTLDQIAANSPEHAATLRARSGYLYTPTRVDTLDNEPAVRRSLWRTPDAVMAAQWRQVIFRHPAAYLAHRVSVFRQVLMTPDLGACLPLQIGVSGPADLVDSLDLAAGDAAIHDGELRYAERFFHTPVYSHVTFVLIALAVIGALGLRRDRADIAMIGMLAAALAFTASFFVISIACDYRYLYAMDLTAIAGLIYLALDPNLTRRTERRRARG